MDETPDVGFARGQLWFRCAHCRGIVTVAEDAGGRKCVCPHCERVVEAPDLVKAGAITPPEPLTTGHRVRILIVVAVVLIVLGLFLYQVAMEHLHWFYR